MRRRREWKTRDAGQAIGLVLISIALIVTVLFAVTAIATRITQRSVAQSAADAAALAGVVGGRTDAETVARRNGALLVAFDIDRVDQDVTVTVRVQVGDESALAVASTAP